MRRPQNIDEAQRLMNRLVEAERELNLSRELLRHCESCANENGLGLVDWLEMLFPPKEAVEIAEIWRQCTAAHKPDEPAPCQNGNHAWGVDGGCEACGEPLPDDEPAPPNLAAKRAAYMEGWLERNRELCEPQDDDLREGDWRDSDAAAVAGGEPAPSEMTTQPQGGINTLDKLALDIREWQRAIFPDATPESCLCHIESEVRELREALDSGDARKIGQEGADVFLLLVGLFDRLNRSLLADGLAKLAKNKIRKWGKPNAKGFVEHVRDKPAPEHRRE